MINERRKKLNMKHTKIICTLGPSSSSYETMKRMVEAGMNVVRLNMSHGTHDEQQEKINTVKKLRGDLKLPLPIIIDTKGPEIRIKTFVDGKIALKKGQHFTFTTKDMVGNSERVSVTYAELPKDLVPGSTILLNDGLLSFEVTKIEGNEIHTICENEGILSDRKGMHFPGTHLSMQFLSDADKRDLEFAVKNDADFIAASFVNNAGNVTEMKEFIEKKGLKGCRIIAKIENQAGVDNIEEILDVADGIMVARGDLGVEIDFRMLPKVQKELIKRAQARGKEVIVATEMLESMIHNPRPTRAEISDVANAVYDETSAVMLSGETAMGKYPVKVVQVMAGICDYVENSIKYYNRFKARALNEASVTDTIAHASCNVAMQLNASAISVSTESGKTARMVSKFRPSVPIVAFVLNEKTYHQLSLSWGVYAINDKNAKNMEEVIEKSNREIKRVMGANVGDLYVITAGIPMGQKGSTNLIQVERIK